MGKNNIKNSPCLHCNNRAIGCHSLCPDYTSYSEDRQLLLKKRKEEMNKSQDYYSIRKHMFNKKLTCY